MSAQHCNREVVRVVARGLCPANMWRDAVAPLLAAGNHSLHFLNAGANKGYAVADFLARLHRHGCTTGGCPTVRQWYNATRIIKSNLYLACGYCNDCRDGAPSSQHHVAEVHVHAFELLAGNQQLLSLLFEHFHVPGTLNRMALSNATGTLWRPRGVRTGQEDARPEMGRRGGRGAYEPTQSITVDEYSQRHGIGRVDWMVLDAEGWDPLIVDGSRRMLRERRVGILEFEYALDRWTDTMNGTAAAWGRLQEVLAWLKVAGYACFWQGGRPAALPRASHVQAANTTATLVGTGRLDRLVAAEELSGCSLGTHKMGNVVCAHPPEIVEVLQGLTAAQGTAAQGA